MSSFGAKRKARKIAVQDDDDGHALPPDSLNPPPEQQEPALQASFKSRKPFKHSALRKSINVNDDEKDDENSSDGGNSKRRRGGRGGGFSRWNLERRDAIRAACGDAVTVVWLERAVGWRW